VSKNRGKYNSLSTKKEQEQLIRDIIEIIEEQWGGVFRSVSCREVDGEVIVKNRHRVDVMAYCQSRLERGFSDIYSICSRGDKPFTMLLSTTNNW
jgi:hypothetical protein